jgi:hypothetical protein
MSAPHPLAPEQRAVSLRDLAGLLASLLLVAAPHALRIPWWLTRKQPHPAYVAFLESDPGLEPKENPSPAPVTS